MKGILTAAMLFSSVAIAVAQAPANRLAPPEPATLAKARAAIREVFGAQIEKARTAVARKEIAAKMLVVANDPKESVENRWVLFAQARDLAMASGDAELTVQALNDFTKTFAVNRFEIWTESVEKLKPLPAANNKVLIDAISVVAEEAVEADDYRLALKLFAAGTRVAQTAKDAGTVKRFEFRMRNLNDQAKSFESAKSDDDAWGKFVCFRKGNWAKGLPLLANSKDQDLAVVAKIDLGNPTEAKDQANLGSAWFDLSEKAKGADRIGMMRRGLFWGMKGAKNLNGLAKAKVEQRIAKASAEVVDADSKEGLFTLYAGEWLVRYKELGMGGVRDYSIDVRGRVTCPQEKISGNLVRSGADVLFMSTTGFVERIHYSANSLQIDHFFSMNDYPNRIYDTAVGTPKK